jgi:hypothetical protein
MTKIRPYVFFINLIYFQLAHQSKPTDAIEFPNKSLTIV